MVKKYIYMEIKDYYDSGFSLPKIVFFMNYCIKFFYIMLFILINILLM